jgi:hypothetical protein
MLTALCAFVFQPIFTMSAQQSQLKVMDQQRFNKFMRAFSRDTVSKQMHVVDLYEHVHLSEPTGCHFTLYLILCHGLQWLEEDFSGIIIIYGTWPLATLII